ncbi:MAG: hypothetical protein L0H19_04295 [Salinisphaera sp.]|nr:hypothetical protein [Salinisphaera sp.]
MGALLERAGAELVGYVRYEVGEGIEKAEEDFAAEVQAQVRQATPAAADTHDSPG